jgi:hypothetical protein
MNTDVISPFFLVIQAYPAFAAWQRDASNQESWAASLEYWKKQLRGAQMHLSLPVTSTAAVKSMGDAGPSQIVEFSIRPDVVNALNALALKVR